MQTLDMALERVLATGKITAEAALEKASDKEAFCKRLTDKNPGLADPSSVT